MVEDRVRLTDEERAALERAVSGQRTLEEVLRWPAVRLADVVVQDEYTHDVVFAWGERFLVYDTT